MIFVTSFLIFLLYISSHRTSDLAGHFGPFLLYFVWWVYKLLVELKWCKLKYHSFLLQYKKMYICVVELFSLYYFIIHFNLYSSEQVIFLNKSKVYLFLLFILKVNKWKQEYLLDIKGSFKFSGKKQNSNIYLKNLNY